MLVIAAMGIAVVLAVGLARVGSAAVDAARAEVAADAVALAAAAVDDGSAAELASLNGAELLEIRRMGLEVQVRVRVGAVVRESRATLLLVAG